MYIMVDVSTPTVAEKKADVKAKHFRGVRTIGSAINRNNFQGGAPKFGQMMNEMRAQEFANSQGEEKAEQEDQKNLEQSMVKEQGGTKKGPKQSLGLASATQTPQQETAEQLAQRNDMKSVARREEVRREQVQRSNLEQAQVESQEFQQSHSGSEQVKAHAMQEKVATEAAQEGNVGERESQSDPEKERKKQLNNWELLAPRVIEDTKNRAIRLDIPGLMISKLL